MTPLTDASASARSAPAPLPFASRFWLAWVCLWRVLVDGVFAARVQQVRGSAPRAAAVLPPSEAPIAAATSPALQLLALLQREGRLVDFVQQDIAPFSDAQVGQVARVVHAGCRRAIAAHLDIEPVRSEPESTRIELPSGFDPATVKLTGQVQGSAPYRGILRHRGWRATRVVLPTALAGHDPHILAPAEVEL